MQHGALVLPRVFDRADTLFPNKRIVSYDSRGRTEATYRDWVSRTRCLGGVLDGLGVPRGGRVGTFGWNTARHLELYFAVPCTGRVLHTINVRLSPEQLTYTIDHAGDEVIVADRSALPLLEPALTHVASVRHLVVIDDGADHPVPDGALDYEHLLAEARPVAFDADDETAAAAICHTSGTTGAPKAVVYSHRSTFLHTMGLLLADSFALAERDVILPVVPMFHACGWGIPYGAIASGATIVLPGHDLSPTTLADHFEIERVTFSAAVPAVWTGLLPQLKGRALGSLRMLVGGGSAVSPTLTDAYRDDVGTPLTQAWGMTETSPLCTVNTPRAAHHGLDGDDHHRALTSIGYPIVGVDARIVDNETGATQPADGNTSGELQVRGPWIADTYLPGPEPSPATTTEDGWLHTGDIATIDPDGYIRLLDRTKDLVKSGGEWISSVQLENEIAAHPAVRECAVIAVASTRWSERPLACIVPTDTSAAPTVEELRAFLEGRVPRWWSPDAVAVLAALPRTSVGKIDKKLLRADHAEATVP